MIRLRYLFIPLLALTALLVRPAHAIGTPTSIVATPSTLELVAGQDATLKIEALDSTNARQDVSGAATYSSNDPRGSFTGLTFTAGKVGTWSISVSYQGLTTTVPVKVTAGALAEIVINPNSSPEIVAINKTLTFSAQGFDAKNNPITVSDIDWSVSPIGQIDSHGKFTPSSIGTGTLVAKKGAIEASVAVKVIAAIITNANTNTTTANTNVTTNTSANTNTAVNDNTNTTANTNESTEATNSTPCTSGQNWLWGILILVLLGGVAILYAFIPVTKTWPAAIGLGAAIILSVLERRYDCGGHNWWPWIAIIGTAALTVLAYQQAPKEPKP